MRNMRASISHVAAAVMILGLVLAFVPGIGPSTPVGALEISSTDWVNQTVSLSEDLLITPSGHYIVRNSVYTIVQTHAFEFGVTVRGTLELVNSTLTSNHPFNVTLEAGGELVMKNSHLRPLGTLSAIDGSAEIFLDNSDVVMNQTSPLTLKSIDLRDSEMPLALGLTAEEVSLTGVRYENIRIMNCDNLDVVTSEIDSLRCVLSYNSIELSDSVFVNVTLSNGKGLAVTDCEIDDLSLGVMKTVILRDSQVGGDISLVDVTTFEAYSSRIDSDIECMRSIRMEDVDVQWLILHGGGILRDVRADSLTVTSTSQTTLQIFGWDQPTDNSNPADVSTDGIEVSTNAKVVLHRYLTVKVTDYGGKGLAGAEVVVEDELTSALVANGTTGADGSVRMSVRAVEMDSGGEEFVGSVQVHSEYKGKTSQEKSLSMNDDVTLTLPMNDVNVPGGDEEGWWSWWYLLIVLGVVLVIGLAAAGGWAYYNFIY